MCTADVKVELFRTFCTPCMLPRFWWNYRLYSIRKLNVAYNDIMRLLLRLPRYHNASQLFANIGVPAFQAVLRCVDTNIELILNLDILTWFHNITHLCHHFNCGLSFRKDVNIRKGCFIQCVNEICTKFAFAHPKCRTKLYMEQAFMGPIYGIYITRNLCFLAKLEMWQTERF